jgi:hypothetical protein
MKARLKLPHHFIALTELHQILAILYHGDQAAEEEPRLLGTVENKVGFMIPCNNVEYEHFF